MITYIYEQHNNQMQKFALKINQHFTVKVRWIDTIRGKKDISFTKVYKCLRQILKCSCMYVMERKLLIYRNKYECDTTLRNVIIKRKFAYSSPSILQPSILRPPLIIRPPDLVPNGNFLC